MANTKVVVLCAVGIVGGLILLNAKWDAEMHQWRTAANRAKVDRYFFKKALRTGFVSDSVNYLDDESFVEKKAEELSAEEDAKSFAEAFAMVQAIPEEFDSASLGTDVESIGRLVIKESLENAAAISRTQARLGSLLAQVQHHGNKISEIFKIVYRSEYGQKEPAEIERLELVAVKALENKNAILEAVDDLCVFMKGNLENYHYEGQQLHFTSQQAESEANGLIQEIGQQLERNREIAKEWQALRVPASQVPTTGLLAYYPFNGNVNDGSGNGNHGTVVGGITPAMDRRGTANSAYSFNGTDGFVDLGSTIHLGDPNTSFTVAAWFKTTTTNYGKIVGDYDGTPTAGDDIFTGNIMLNDAAGSSTISTGIRNLPLTGYAYDKNSNRRNLNDGLWHFIVFQGDASSSKLRVYIDNVLDNDVTYNPSHNYHSSPHWRIGANRFASTTANQFFAGIIDEVRIYSKALTAAEISALYNK